MINCKRYGICILVTSMNNLCWIYTSMLMASQPCNILTSYIPVPCVLKLSNTRPIEVIPTSPKPLIDGRISRLFWFLCPTFVRTTREEETTIKTMQGDKKLCLVQSLHDLRVLTHAQQKKLSVQETPENGNATDATAASTNTTSDSSSDHDPVNASSSAAPFVETVKDDDSSLNSSSMPNLRVHHPSSDSDSDNSDSASQPSVHVPPSASQAFAPSSQ